MFTVDTCTWILHINGFMRKQSIQLLWTIVFWSILLSELVFKVYVILPAFQYVYFPYFNPIYVVYIFKMVGLMWTIRICCCWNCGWYWREKVLWSINFLFSTLFPIKANFANSYQKCMVFICILMLLIRGIWWYDLFECIIIFCKYCFCKRFTTNHHNSTCLIDESLRRSWAALSWVLECLSSAGFPLKRCISQLKPLLHFEHFKRCVLKYFIAPRPLTNAHLIKGVEKVMHKSHQHSGTDFFGC